MERLTRLCENNQNGLYTSHVTGSYFGIYPNTELSAVVERLAYYEDLEEHGKLVILPCKIGELVYVIVPKCKPTLSCPYNGGCGTKRCDGLPERCGSYIEARHFDYYLLDNFGTTVFLTRKEAEKVLANEVKV